jgi:NAD-dependent DNA ligase
MNIEGLGASLVDQLIAQGLVHDYADLYQLTPEQLEALVVAPKEPKSERAVPRKLGKVGRNVVAQLERSKANDLSRLIYALGIRHVGEKAAATLARPAELEAFRAFLDDHGIDTSDIKDRGTQILNNGVIVSGGTVTAEGLAVGANAKASILKGSASKQGA